MKVNITKVEVGMFWYEDDSFSFEKTTDKKVKAIVEFVNKAGGVICGDLTASELFDIKEKQVDWNKARAYIKKFHYPITENEKVIWFDEGGMRSVYEQYSPVRKAFKSIGKKCREDEQWTCGHTTGLYAWHVNFSNGAKGWKRIDSPLYVRPTLLLSCW